MAVLKFADSMTGPGFKLGELLLDAAGISHEHRKQVRSISCHCKFDEVVTFDIEFIADQDTITAALKAHE